METITKYKAYDGTEFTDPAKCQEYEQACHKIEAVTGRLPGKPNLPWCKFENGSGYLQHDEETFISVRNELCEIANGMLANTWFKQTIEKGMDVDASWAGRIISEIPNKALNNAWHRVMCTDSQFREWGQPYFASHPSKAEQVRLN